MKPYEAGSARGHRGANGWLDELANVGPSGGGAQRSSQPAAQLAGELSMKVAARLSRVSRRSSIEEKLKILIHQQIRAKVWT